MKTIVSEVVPRPGVRRFQVDTEGSTYSLTIHDRSGKYSALLSGWLSGGRGQVEVHDNAARIGDRSLFTSPPPSWLGKSLRVGSITTSPVQAVHDLDTGTVSRTSPPEAPRTTGRDGEAERIKALADSIAKAQKENQALKNTSMKVSVKGGLSLYGLGRWPVTLYKEQWRRLLEHEAEIREFLLANDSKLKSKGPK